MTLTLEPERRRIEAPTPVSKRADVREARTFGGLRPVLFVLLVWVFAGCSTPRFNQMVIGPDYQVSNVFRLSSSFPKEFRRVAVLPLAVDPSQADGPAAQQTLEPVLQTELLKTKRFDLVRVTPEQLQQWTGRAGWSAEDKLPANFFAKLHEQTGCDGVLFAQVSRFRPYPPLALGWKLKLIANNQSQILWSVDEIFDAGEARVSNSARRYEQEHQKGGPTTDAPMILASPQRFGQYTLFAVLETLPTP